MDSIIRSIAELIKESKHLVIFTGAGISTASGISDYRGPNGVWTRRDKGLNPLPMSIPWDKIKPNEGHYSIVKLFEIGLVKTVISQNVDGLHLNSGLKSEILAEVHDCFCPYICFHYYIRSTTDNMSSKDSNTFPP